MLYRFMNFVNLDKNKKQKTDRLSHICINSRSLSEANVAGCNLVVWSCFLKLPHGFAFTPSLKKKHLNFSMNYFHSTSGRFEWTSRQYFILSYWLFHFNIWIVCPFIFLTINNYLMLLYLLWYKFLGTYRMSTSLSRTPLPFH